MWGNATHVCVWLPGACDCLRRALFGVVASVREKKKKNIVEECSWWLSVCLLVSFCCVWVFQTRGLCSRQSELKMFYRLPTRHDSPSPWCTLSWSQHRLSHHTKSQSWLCLANSTRPEKTKETREGRYLARGSRGMVSCLTGSCYTSQYVLLTTLSVDPKLEQICEPLRRPNPPNVKQPSKQRKPHSYIPFRTVPDKLAQLLLKISSLWHNLLQHEFDTRSPYILELPGCWIDLQCT